MVQFVIQQVLRACFITLFYLPVESFSQELIAHPDVNTSELTRNEARAIFGMRLRKWPDGAPISVFVLADQTLLHRRFVSEKLSMLPHQLRRNWDRFVYTGTGQAPTQVETETEMLEKVRNTPGSIGYIGDASNIDEVQAIEIR